MKKYILFFALSFLLFSPLISSAKSLSDVKISLSENLNKDCHPMVNPDTNIASACYREENGIHKFFIRKDLPVQLLPRVLVRLYGSYLMSDVDDNQLRGLFIPPRSWYPVRETAVDGFVLWFYGVRMTPSQDKFFRDLLVK